MNYKHGQKDKKWRYKVSPDCLDSMIKEKINPAEIARLCGCTRQAIHLRLKKLGVKYACRSKGKVIKEEVMEYIKKGFTTKEIADKLDTNIWVIHYHTKTSGLKPNSIDDRNHASMLFWRSKGLSATEIAKEVGSHSNTVMMYLRSINKRAADGRLDRARQSIVKSRISGHEHKWSAVILLRNRCYSKKEISEELNLPYQVVANYFYRKKIKAFDGRKNFTKKKGK